MQAKIVNARTPYATEDELDWLYNVKLPALPTIVMLGAGPGVMMLAVLEGHQQQKYTIIVDNDPTPLGSALTHIEAANLQLTRTINSDSAEAALLFEPDSIDLLIVDADHSYEAVKRDIEAWIPKVTLEGKVFFHDYDAIGTCLEGANYGVKQAVDEWYFNTNNDFLALSRVGTAFVFGRYK